MEILEQLKYFNEGYLLDLPLRASGIMVKEEQDWKFQQLQFQFDLKIQWILYVIVLLALLLLGSIIRLIFVIARSTGKGQA